MLSDWGIYGCCVWSLTSHAVPVFSSSETVFLWLLMNNRCLTLHASKNCYLSNSGILARENRVSLCSSCQKGRIHGIHVVLRRCDLSKLPRYVVPRFLPSTTGSCLHRVLLSFSAADLLGIWGSVSSGLSEQ